MNRKTAWMRPFESFFRCCVYENDLCRVNNSIESSSLALEFCICQLSERSNGDENMKKNTSFLELKYRQIDIINI